jgi:hypothetical protein
MDTRDSCYRQPEPQPDGPRNSDVMARLTLSALERASGQRGFWSEPEVHRALLVSGLSVLVCSLARLMADLG